MKILIFSQYFWPEPFLINDLALKLKELGHSVTVFTGKPNYPDGDIYLGYTRSNVQEELYKDIPVYRVPLRPRKKGGSKNLTLNYLSFVYSALKHSYKFSKKKEFDVIFVYAVSPITAIIPAIILKWLTKSHLVAWIQDLWPESLEATGFVHNRFLLATVKSLVRVIYYFTDTVLVQSKGFIPFVCRLTNKNKIIYYPNSVLDTFTSKTFIQASIPEKILHLLDTNFCLIFAGNIGTAQAIETIVQTAELLKEISDLKIILVGSGSKGDWVKQQINEKNLNNLVIAGRYSASDMPFILSKASALLVTLRNEEIFQYTIPSKIQTYLAAGKPIIAALDGEGAKVILEANAGLTSPAENVEKLAKNIKKLYHMPVALRDEMGCSGRAYFLEHFEMAMQSKRLVEIFESRIELMEGSR